MHISCSVFLLLLAVFSTTNGASKHQDTASLFEDKDLRNAEKEWKPPFFPTANGRRLSQKQNGPDAKTHCTLDNKFVRQYYNSTSRTWCIADEVLKLVKNNVEAILNCTNRGDAVVFQTRETIKPTSTIAVPWKLTLSAQSSCNLAKGREITKEDVKAFFTCPDRGELFVLKDPFVTIANIVIENCNNTRGVVVVDPGCGDHSKKGTVQFIDVEFRNISVSYKHRIVDVKNGSCQDLNMKNVLFQENKCYGNECILLASNNILKKIRLVQNRGQNSTANRAFFSASVDSLVKATGVNASNNEIRIFAVQNSTIFLGSSHFEGNGKNSSSPGSSLEGGSVLFTNQSNVIVSETGFMNNHATTGGALYIISSRLDLENCNFVANYATQGSGGAIFALDLRSFDVSLSTFTQNSAVNGGGGIYIGHTWNVLVDSTKFQNNSGEAAGVIYLVHGSMRLILCDLSSNNVSTGAAALLVDNGDVHVQNSTFLKNNGYDRGGCIFAFNSSIQVNDSRFSENKARGVSQSIYLTRLADSFLAKDFNQSWDDRSGSVLSAYYSNISFHGVSITKNFAEDSGTVALFYSMGTFVRVKFTRNNVNIYGAAIYLQFSNASMTHSMFANNHAELEGGGLSLKVESSIYLLDCVFKRNSALKGGGGAINSMNSSGIHLEDAKFLNNNANYGGACFFSNGEVKITRVKFVGNRADASGGGIYGGNIRGVFNNLSFLENSAKDDGGASSVTDSNNLVLDRCFFYSNSANNGGAIKVFNSSTTFFNNCAFRKNVAESSGGVASIKASVGEISLTLFEMNKAKDGGALLLGQYDDIKLSSCVFQNNVASQNGGDTHISGNSSIALTSIQFLGGKGLHGGAMYIEDESTAVLRFSNFSNCTAQVEGGGIWISNSEMEVKRTKFKQCIATNSGGAIYASAATMNFTQCSFKENQANKFDGGGICLTQNTELTAKMINLVSNSAKMHGGGMNLSQDSTLLCHLCTFLNNTAVKGAGLAASSEDTIPIVAQLQDSRFGNNVAESYGGGLLFHRSLNRSIDCEDANTTCGRVVLLKTGFVGNKAVHSGAAILTTDVNGILASCDSGGEYNGQFLDRKSIGDLRIINSTNLCQSWKSNELSSGAHERIIGTLGHAFNFSASSEDGVKIVGNITSGFVLQNVTSGKPLPTINVVILDHFGQGPAPTIPNKFELQMKSPDGYFEGLYVAEINAGVASYSRIIGVVDSKAYTVQLSPMDSYMEAVNISIDVRSCMMGEEPIKNYTLCQECDGVSYNFDKNRGSCKECPSDATCMGRFIVPNDGYWHSSPCHKNVMKCTNERACIKKERIQLLQNYTHNLLDCDFNATFLAEYNTTLCAKGYTNLLCGSCNESYGLTFGFRCSQCPSDLKSLFTLCLLALYLLILSSFTIKGGLPTKPKNNLLKSRQSAQQPLVASTSQNSQISIQMSEIKLENLLEHQHKNVSDKETNMSQEEGEAEEEIEPINDLEMTRWMATEILKGAAIAAAVNLNWSNEILDMFETTEYVGGMTPPVLFKPIDCLFSKYSTKHRAFWRTLISLLVLAIVMLFIVLFWGGITLYRKRSFKYFWRRSILSLVAVTYISYLGLTKLAIRVFHCINIYDDDQDHTSNSTNTYWAIDTSIRCFEKDHLGLIILGTIVLVLVTICFPLATAITLFSYKGKNGPPSKWIIETTGFLFRAYKKELAFWESIVMLRKATLSIIIVFAYSLEPTYQGLLAAILLLACHYMHVTFAPYRKEFHKLNYYESGSLFVASLTLLLGQFFTQASLDNPMKNLVNTAIILVNSIFCIFLLIALFCSAIEHIKKAMQYKGIDIPEHARWWIVLKVFIVSKCSKSCNSNT